MFFSSLSEFFFHKFVVNYIWYFGNRRPINFTYRSVQEDIPTRPLLEVSTIVLHIRIFEFNFRVGGICFLHECVDLKILPAKLNKSLFRAHCSSTKVSNTRSLPAQGETQPMHVA